MCVQIQATDAAEEVKTCKLQPVNSKVKFDSESIELFDMSMYLLQITFSLSLISVP